MIKIHYFQIKFQDVGVEGEIPPGSEILHKGVAHVDDTPFSSKLMSDQFKHEKQILEDF